MPPQPSKSLVPSHLFQIQRTAFATLARVFLVNIRVCCTTFRAELQRVEAREAERVRIEEAAVRERDRVAEQLAQRAERTAAAAAKREAARLVEQEAATLRAAAQTAAAVEAVAAREAERAKAAAIRDEEMRQQLEEIAATEQTRAAEIASFKAEAAATAKGMLMQHARSYPDGHGDVEDDARASSSTRAYADGKQAGMAADLKLCDLERRLDQPPVRPFLSLSPPLFPGQYICNIIPKKRTELVDVLPLCVSTGSPVPS